MIWNVQLKQKDQMNLATSERIDEDQKEFTVWLEDLGLIVTDVKIENAKERSKTNNRRPERSPKMPWTIIQPAGCRMHYWRQAGEG